MNQKAIEEALLIAEAQSNLKHQAVIVHTLRDLCRRLKEADQVIEQRNAMLSAVWKPEAAPVQEPVKFEIGGRYNWKGQPERLIYMGYNFSGNGRWHQFAKVEDPEKVWCEVLPEDLSSFEATPPAAQRQWVGLTDEDVAEIERNSLHRGQAIQAIEAKLKEKNT